MLGLTQDPWKKDRLPAVQLPFELGGSALGSAFFGPLGGAGGRLAGANAGNTFQDMVLKPDINRLGFDVSNNTPFPAEGWGGLLNGATGLPLAGLFGLGSGGGFRGFGF